ncbi:MAG: redoxin domain-containing protein [Pedosphaera sp.]|nr:redoxin domain-containing protein [Pedosphaera sp.]
MLRYRGIIWLSALAAFVAAPLAAQPVLDATGPRPGHSTHGDAFNEGPRQRAYLMSGVGHVEFPITTTASGAQAFFNQGVAQLHGFWYFEAERSFRQVAALDAQSAMAHWGLAMANINNTRRAKEFIKKAVALKPAASPRERLWIDALAALYSDELKDAKARQKAHIDQLTAISEKFPDDIEAKAFLALKIWMDGEKISPSRPYTEVEKILKPLLAAHPEHPAHHYRVHLWDYRDAKQAVENAAACGPAADGIAHMWHMPGHVYSRLHRYADAAWQQEASARVDHAHTMRDRVLPDQIHNYAHNNEWLTRDLSHVGRVRDAIALAKNMIELPRIPQISKGTNATGSYSVSKTSSHAYGRTHLLALLNNYELWNELIALAQTPYLAPAAKDTEDQVKIAKSLAKAYFSLGRTNEGQQQLALLEKTLALERAKQLPKPAPAPATNAPVNAPAKTATKSPSPTNRQQQLESASAEARTYAALAAGNTTNALAHLAKAKDLSKDELARLHLALGDKTKAEQLALEAVKSATNQIRHLATYIHILQQSGKTQPARDAFQKLREQAAHADLDLPLLARLAPLAKDLDLPADWRAKRIPAADLGPRPPLDSLGPFRWQPSPAPEWSLPDSKGRTLSLAQFRGRPIVLLFYLGAGCPHCVEQLNIFAPANADFAKLGITVIGVSTDTADGLKATFAKTTLGSAFPFPLVSDPSLSAFKSYRAYDDFEQMPLHGTFLIDAEGRVRWQDISYQPFQQVDFLLEEAQRLLSLNKPAAVAPPLAKPAPRFGKPGS